MPDRSLDERLFQKVEGHRRMEQEEAMTKPNPFDAVISDLRWIISNHETADFAPIVDIEAAIRVLEASNVTIIQEVR